MLLEEVAVKRVPSQELFKENGPLDTLRQLIPDDDGFGYTQKVLLSRLLVVRDELFSELVTTATEVITRIKLNALGTTTNIPEGQHPEIEGDDRTGNLFVEEVVPSESLFVSALRSRPELAGVLRETIPAVIQLGGGETVGRGITHVRYLERTEGEG